MQVLCRSFPGARLHEVIGKVADMLIEVPGVNPHEGVGDTSVQALPAHERHPAEQSLTDLLVGKNEARLPPFMRHDEPRALDLVQSVEQIIVLLLGKRRQKLERERPPNTGCGGQDALRGFANAVDAAPENQSHRLRHLDLANLDLRKPFAGRIREAMLLSQMPVDLLHEEGDPFGLIKYQAHQAFGALLTGQATQHARNLDGAQPLEREARYSLQP